MYDDEAVRATPRVLREGYLTAFLADQGVRGLASTFVPFFGRLAKTPRGPAVFALRLGTPMVFGTMTAAGATGSFMLTVHPSESEPGEARLFSETFFTPSGRARFTSAPHASAAEEPDEELAATAPDLEELRHRIHDLHTATWNDVPTPEIPAAPSFEAFVVSFSFVPFESFDSFELPGRNAAVRQLLKQGGGGSILNMGSVLGFSPSPRHFAPAVDHRGAYSRPAAAPTRSAS